MKILFCVTNFGFLRNFQSTISLLAERGHRLHLVTDRTDSAGGVQMVDQLVSTHRTITFEIMPAAKRRLWYALASALRLTLDYWRYLDPRYRTSVRLRARAERQVPGLSRLLVRLPLLSTLRGQRALAWTFRQIERVIPSRPEVTALLAREAPDLLFVTPMLYFGSQQVDHVRSARALGIPSILVVGSWDHLTTKGLIHEIPDYVAVWNDAQKIEAIELHGVPAERIIVTGAQAYDHWFEGKPSVSREEFYRRIGLDADRPLLLYMCSSPFIAPYEVGFVRKWIAAIRSSNSGRVRSVGVLVRPHPQNSDQWKDVDLSEFGNAAIWPRGGANPIDAAAKADYFDSMFYSHAVVGVNTSALIESGIVGRPVYSILAEEFSGTQEGTLHFQHLKNVEGGLLRLASTLEEHTAQIARTLDAPAPADDPKVRRFIQAFVRPHGLGVAATPRLAEAIERIGAGGRLPARGTPLPRVAGRVLVAPLAFAVMALNMERDRWRSLFFHVLRPSKLAARALVGAGIHTARYIVRVGGRMLKIAIGRADRLARLGLRRGRLLLRRVVVLPLLRGIRRARLLATGAASGSERETD